MVSSLCCREEDLQQQRLLSNFHSWYRFKVTVKVRVIIGKFTRYGGAEYIAFRFSRFLYDLGLLKEVLCFKNDITNFPGKIIKIPFLKPGRFLKAVSFNYFANRYLKEFSERDVVNFTFSRVENCHVFSAGGGTHVGFLRKSIKAYKGVESIRKRLTRSLNPINYYMPLLEKRVFFTSKRIIAMSQQVKEEIVNHYGELTVGKISVIPNSVDSERFNPGRRKTKRKGLRKHFNLKNRDFVLGFVSSNFKLKGLSYIIQSLTRLPENVFLFVAGGRNPEKYKKLAHQLGVNRRIFFFGKVSQMENFYSVIDCLVHPSFYDTFANVVSEALAMNVPVIVSQNTGAKDLIVEGKNGFILKTIDDKEISRCVKKVMNLNPDFSITRFFTDNEVFTLYLKEAERAISY